MVFRKIPATSTGEQIRYPLPEILNLLKNQQFGFAFQKRVKQLYEKDFVLPSLWLPFIEIPWPVYRHPSL
jgi:hypothetical protein